MSNGKAVQQVHGVSNNYGLSFSGGPIGNAAGLYPGTRKRIQKMEHTQYEPIPTLGKLGDY